MASVVIIDPDRAGKTTLTRLLESAGILPFGYRLGVDLKARDLTLEIVRHVVALSAPQHGHTVAQAAP